MTLLDLINEHPLVKDDTEIGLILWDPENSSAIAQLSGCWFEDHILTYMNWTVEHFTYWAASNRLVIRITQEGVIDGH